MDVFFLTWFGRIVLPLFVVTWVGVFASIVLVERHRRSGPDGPALAEKLRSRLAAGLFTSAIAIGGLACLQWYAVRHRFNALASAPPTTLLLQRGSASATVLDAAAVRDFCRLVQDAPSVSGHHSHPTECVYVTFEQPGYSYALARDSEVADEYWLLWAGYPGSGPLKELAVVRQLHSEALTKWLGLHQPQSVRR